MTRADKADLFVHAWRLLAPKDAPQPEREVRFAPPRRWRFDFAWVCVVDTCINDIVTTKRFNVAVEVDGGQWAAHGGRHNTDADREKLNAAAALGYRVLRFSTQMLERDPQACVEQVLRALGYERSDNA